MSDTLQSAPPADDFAYDVFVSYSSKDAAWVRGPLLDWLEAQGYTVCIDFRDFVAGAPSVDEMERAVETSRRTLLILTPAYLASPWAKFEHTLAQTLARGFQDRRLIPLRKAPCTPPPRIKALTAVNFVDPPSEDFAWSRLLTALGTPTAQTQLAKLDPDVIPDLAPLPQGSRMPLSHNKLFVGREDDLRELALVLKAGETAAIGQVAAATGLGGIGKTQLACEFVHRYGQYFKGGVCWLSFADPTAVRAEIAACGGVKGMSLRDDFDTLPLETQVALVQRAWASQTPRLLVFDNCEDEALLHEWRPTTGGSRVLITSRRAQWSPAIGVHTLRLEVLPRAESVALLRKLAPNVSADDAELGAVAEALGDLPLALHLAGSFLELYHADMTPAEYLAELGTIPSVQHESFEGEDISPTGHVQSVARTFTLSYERLKATNAIDAVALQLLARAAYFAPGELIPRDLLKMTVNIDPEDKRSTRQATKALQRLINLGLIESEAEDMLRLHRLLAAFVRAVAKDTEAQAAVEQTMLNVANHFNNAGDPRPLLQLQPHLRAITDAAHQREDEQAADLCLALDYHLDAIGDYAGAQKYSQRALAIVERVLGMEHPDTARSLNNLGRVLRAQGDLMGARGYYERALAIWERVLGTEHPSTATSLNNVGVVLRAQGDYAGARDYYERALAIRERVLGAEHPDTAQSLNNVGAVLQAQGDLAGARSYFERALAIRERVLGTEHPSTATSLNNLGYVLRAQGDYAGARDYYERALAIWERVLGTEHPSTATSLNNVGAVLRAQGDYAGARDYYERALAIRERVLGAEHPDTATSLNNLGYVLQDQGDYAGARGYLERALAIFEQRLGPDHPTTHTVRNNLAALNAQPQTAEQQIAEIEQRGGGSG